MEIKTLPINQIRRAKYNPRKALKPGDPAYDKLKKAVETFGLVEPLVWNKRSGNLVGGHQRLSVIEAGGAREVEVSVVDLDDRDEKALNLALNKHGGEWDFATLADLVQELDAGDFDMEVAGFRRGGVGEAGDVDAAEFWPNRRERRPGAAEGTYCKAG